MFAWHAGEPGSIPVREEENSVTDEVIQMCRIVLNILSVMAATNSIRVKITKSKVSLAVHYHDGLCKNS